MNKRYNYSATACNRSAIPPTRDGSTRRTFSGNCLHTAEIYSGPVAVNPKKPVTCSKKFGGSKFLRKSGNRVNNIVSLGRLRSNPTGPEQGTVDGDSMSGE